MENLTTTNYDHSALGLGNNEFETNVITIPAGASVVEGDLLKRDAATKKLVRVTDTATETPVAISTIGATNSGGAAADFPLRAIIGGKVPAGKIKVAGVAANAVQLDLIRSYGITPVVTTDVSKLDNQ
jgi:hypothetical protein